MARRQFKSLAMEDSQITTVRLHKELWTWIRVEAMNRGLTMVDLISQVLTAYREKTWEIKCISNIRNILRYVNSSIVHLFCAIELCRLRSHAIGLIVSATLV